MVSEGRNSALVCRQLTQDSCQDLKSEELLLFDAAMLQTPITVTKQSIGVLEESVNLSIIEDEPLPNHAPTRLTSKPEAD